MTDIKKILTIDESRGGLTCVPNCCANVLGFFLHHVSSTNSLVVRKMIICSLKFIPIYSSQGEELFFKGISTRKVFDWPNCMLTLEPILRPVIWGTLVCQTYVESYPCECEHSGWPTCIILHTLFIGRRDTIIITKNKTEVLVGKNRLMPWHWC